MLTPGMFLDQFGLAVDWAVLLDDLPDAQWPTPVDVRTPIPPRRHYGCDHYWGGNVSVTVAPGGVGKTAFSTAETMGLAMGRAVFGGRRPDRPLRVWFINAEDEADEARRRIMAAAEVHGLSVEGFFLDSTRAAPLILARQQGSGGATVCRGTVERIVDAIERERIDVVVIDPLAAILGINENDNGAMNTALGACRQVADRTGCAVELIHHATKAARVGEAGVEQARGAGALIDGARSVRFLTPMSAEQAKAMGVSDHRGIVRVTVGKANLAPTGAVRWFRLEPHTLGNGDVVAVAKPWEPPSAADVAPEALDRALALIASGRNRISPQSADWAGRAVCEALGWAPGDVRAHQILRGLERDWRLRRGERRVNGRTAPVYVVGDGYADALED